MILLAGFFAGCSTRSSEQQNVLADSAKAQTANYPLTEQPVKTIVDFLKWYRDHPDVQQPMVNNSTNEPFDSTKFYSVNFDATEKYLKALTASGFISDVYVAKWRRHFKKLDDNFKKNPSNEGPPDGFDYDLVMLSQEYDEDLKNVEKSTVASQTVSGDHAVIKMNFTNGGGLTYTLSKQSSGNWLIDDIEAENLPLEE